MVKYKKIYMDAFGYDVGDFIPSEISGAEAVDIHHIVSRGKLGEDRIENLMAVTREEHTLYGDNKKWMAFLLYKHHEFLSFNGVNFSQKWFEDQIKKYED